MTAARLRHVLVRQDYDGRQHSGLVWEWRQAPDGGWEALVQYVVDDGGAILLDWLPAAALTPVRSQPNIGSQYG